jgi:hypothetical protein
MSDHAKTEWWARVVATHAVFSIMPGSAENAPVRVDDLGAMIDELDRLRTALATAMAERDAAHNEALEKAAALAEIAIDAIQMRPSRTVFPSDAKKIGDVIRAAKKGTQR